MLGKAAFLIYMYKPPPKYLLGIQDLKIIILSSARSAHGLDYNSMQRYERFHCLHKSYCVLIFGNLRIRSCYKYVFGGWSVFEIWRDGNQQGYNLYFLI